MKNQTVVFTLLLFLSRVLFTNSYLTLSDLWNLHQCDDITFPIKAKTLGCSATTDISPGLPFGKFQYHELVK